MTSEYLTLRTEGDVVFVTITEPNLESESVIQSVGDNLFALVDQGTTRMVVSFANVRYMASSLLGKLIALYRRMKAVQGTVVLCDLSPYLRTIFETSRLDQLLPIRHDEAEALEALHASPTPQPGT